MDYSDYLEEGERFEDLDAEDQLMVRYEAQLDADMELVFGGD